MLTEIKIFKNSSLVDLQSSINMWLEDKTNITVTNMQYSQNVEDIMHAKKVSNSGAFVPAITERVSTNVCLLLYTL